VKSSLVFIIFIIFIIFITYFKNFSAKVDLNSVLIKPKIKDNLISNLERDIN